MRLTTRARQAVIALIDVALQQRTGPVTLAGISRRRNMSVSYLEQMFSDLRRGGLVESTRGPGGGYTIARKLADITVADIVQAVDQNDLKSPARQEGSEAPGGQRCLTPELWSALRHHVIEYLASVTLKSLVDEQQPINDPGSAQGQGRQAEPVLRRVAPSPPKAPNSVFELGRFLAP